MIVTLFILNQNEVIHLSFLWLNAVGALLVVGFGLLFQQLFGSDTKLAANSRVQ